MDLGLRGKVAVVTGAAGGIGAAICRMLLDEGALIAPMVRGNPDRLAELFQYARATNVDEASIVPIDVDVTDATAVEETFTGLEERLGRVDVLVNNAGMSKEGTFLSLREPGSRALAEVNLWAPMRTMRLALKPMMHARRGAVVNVSSALASRGGRGAAVYTMTKAALESITRTLAIEMAPKGIRLNVVAPGVIDTPMSRRLRNRSGVDVLAHVPMRRVGSPEDVASAVCWLASDRASGYVTGSVLVVDGGYTL